jgi:ferrous iron transport protein A
VSFNKQNLRRHPSSRRSSPETLAELRRGEHGILDSIDLPAEAGGRLMELGFVPGSIVTAAGSAPGGDPRVFRVDGSEVALRRQTAARLMLRSADTAAGQGG